MVAEIRFYFRDNSPCWVFIPAMVVWPFKGTNQRLPACNDPLRDEIIAECQGPSSPPFTFLPHSDISFSPSATATPHPPHPFLHPLTISSSYPSPSPVCSWKSRGSCPTGVYTCSTVSKPPAMLWLWRIWSSRMSRQTSIYNQTHLCLEGGGGAHLCTTAGLMCHVTMFENMIIFFFWLQ